MTAQKERPAQPDPTVPGTRAHLRWHKDDSPRALARYEREFLTHLLTHEHEVCDTELPAEDANARARARRSIGAGHAHERQPRTFGDHDGLRGDGALSLGTGGLIHTTSAPVALDTL